MMGSSLRFARRVFQVAGWSGLGLLVPHYFLEGQVGRDYPPPINHPEYFYGMVGVGVAFQLVFLVIARDPLRYRAMMLPSVVEKFSFALAVFALYARGRVPALMVGFGLMDLTLGGLFLIAFARLGRWERQAGSA